ncbi:Serine/threonine-protein kinase dclk2 [Ilyodon furcidens]|uniref:Serine/threonine-protein kinase dclk2 n=1 Tax=Ilyodon furcidens TaxID=33524 RepID=A0ABV0UDG2_9TELE
MVPTGGWPRSSHSGLAQPGPARRNPATRRSPTSPDPRPGPRVGPRLRRNGQCHKPRFVCYGLKVDIWAAGVITYILLCGFPPFRSENNQQEDLFDQILLGMLDFPSPYWDNITDSAKDLIRKMLLVNAEARFTAKDVLSHPWVTDDAVMENNMKTEVSGKLKTHFNTAPKQNSTTAGVSIIMVSC